MNFQENRIQNNQKFLLKLLHLHIGSYYPLRKWLGISYKGKIDEITHLSFGYNTRYFKKKGKWYKQQTREYQQPDLGYKLNLILDRIPQLVLLPTILQPAYGLGALMFFFLTQKTYQPSTKDNTMSLSLPNNNYGGETWLRMCDFYYDVNRILLEFDISDIPNGATFSQGDLSLYYYLYEKTNPSGRTTYAYKLTRTDWSESQSTWNIYKTGSNWTAAGGDYTTSNPNGGSVNMPANYGWVTWDIQAIVEDAYENSNDVEVLVRFPYENQGIEHTYDYFYSKEYATDTTLRPKLTVTYTVSQGAFMAPNKYW